MITNEWIPGHADYTTALDIRKKVFGALPEYSLMQDQDTFDAYAMHLIVYCDDVACFGGMNAIRGRGLMIPGDISVAGYDGIRASQYEEPRLTTVWQNVEEIGEIAARTLIEEIERPMTTVPVIHEVKGRLLEGQTVKKL